MTEQRPRIGYKLVGKITGLKGECSWGHKVGDEIELSMHNTGGLCGFFYHDVFPRLSVLQLGGSYPWGDPDVVNVECPDRWNCLAMELRRIKE